MLIYQALNELIGAEMTEIKLVSIAEKPDSGYISGPPIERYMIP